MSIQKVLQVTSPTLRQKSKPVANFDKKIERLIQDLTDTLLTQKNPVGVGLAAPQIGKNVCIFVIKSGKNITPFINPKIIWKSKEANDPIPLRGKTRNSKHEARNKMENGKWKMENVEHEYIMEGCLSLPHYYGPVKRSDKIKVSYQTPKLEITTKSFKGLPSQIIQHEIDHLNGLLFVDRLLEQKRKLFRLKGKEWEEVELP